ncbi:hypothetical protein SMACR_03899 [Sordaria macrospora]|uniref:WGS project CABT00000000 data, contig 2.16 n=2 Tax=Sordaria macrospora TaxID=5147 RepID=F7W094_SORMK|nr:uncharacterized protein SMAC_03899 [Sordaria macrospora k-hell]KAA8631150.1 hypothetical protein SMACR_03899 [Sordaria macrospora]CCC11193.1 unnamed protein product [Sordaria macrospora k-hell]
MAPIRLALVGLSSTSPSWLSNAHLPYLLSSRGKDKFQIVALQNSSVEAARKAIDSYKLDPETVKAYGSPEELAKDDNVELVVVGTRVDVHYSNLKPLLEVWKDTSIGKKRGVYSEWPLASNLQQIEELIQLAKETRVKTVVGTQGFASPVVKKVEELLKSGKIGKVLSSEVRLSGLTEERDAVAEKIEYFTRREVGGNLWSIGGGHIIDLLQFTLGDLPPSTIKSHFQIQHPLVPITNSTGAVTKTAQSNVPDLLYLTGSLPSSSFVQANASLSLRMRRGPPFPGEPAFVWTITGEKGEIRVTSTESVTIFLGLGEVKVEVHDYGSNEVEEVEWRWEGWQEELKLPGPARNVGSVYEGVYEDWVNDGRGNEVAGAPEVEGDAFGPIGISVVRHMHRTQGRRRHHHHHHYLEERGAIRKWDMEGKERKRNEYSPLPKMSNHHLHPRELIKHPARTNGI